MDEENQNNNEKNVEEKAKDLIKDNAQMVKDTANLAKNIGTGNVLEIVKDSINLLKNKQFRRRLIFSMLYPFIGIAILGCLLFGIFNAVGDSVQGIVDKLANFFVLDNDGAIVVDNNQVDTIINTIKELGVSIDGLKLMGDVDYSNPDIQAENQKALRRYIKEFFEAQAMTQTLNTKPNWIEENILHKGKPYGTVYVYRTLKEEEVIDTSTKLEQLGYVPYEKMVALQQTGNVDTIKKKFSIDSDGKLVIAGWTETEVYVDGVKNEGASNKTVILKAIDYKNAISQYTTSMNFFLYLAMVSENPEFVSAVTDLVKNSEIRLVVMDKKTTTSAIETHSRITHTKTLTEGENGADDEITTSSNSSSNVVETINKTTTPIVNVTYVKTWFCEQSITYNKKTEEYPPIVGESVQEEADDPEPPLTSEGSVSWVTDKQLQVTTNGSSRVNEGEIYYEQGVNSGVIPRVGEKGCQGIKDKNGNGKVDENEIVDEESRFIGLLDDKFKIPNSTRYDSAGGNVVSGAEWLFYLFQKDASLQNLEIWMRYILNIYTGSNRYGEINFEDIAINYEIREIPSSTTGSNYIVNTTMAPEICIKDENVLKQAIGKVYSGKMKENLTSEAQNFISMQTRYNVNAVFAIAVTVIESSAGTNWAAIDPSTYNWYSITGSYNGKTYKNPNSSNPRTWRVYPSFKEATFDFGDLIANSSYYFKALRYSVEEIAPVYCSKEWGNSVISVMNEILVAAGISVQTEGISEGGVTTDEAARQLQDYIETELIHTQVHKGGAYQSGPFARWWTAGYNNLQPFQCTWWANGRASMYLEQHGTKYKKYPTQTGHGGYYYDINKASGWFNYGQEPKPNSIISWTKGEYGHVAYVEGVTSDGIYISHAGSGTSWYGVQKIPLNGSIWSGYKLNGYIYLDEPK